MYFGKEIPESSENQFWDRSAICVTCFFAFYGILYSILIWYLDD